MNLNIFLGKLRVLHMLRMLRIRKCLIEQEAMKVMQMVSYQVPRTRIMLFIRNSLIYFETWSSDYAEEP
jgi:hypothetical protein